MRDSLAASGIEYCGSKGLCLACCGPVLRSAMEAVYRRRVMEWLNGGRRSGLLVTLTSHHNVNMSLGDCVMQNVLAFRWMTQQRAFRSWKKHQNVKGWLKALEVTWSPVNGWHVHIHLAFLRACVPVLDTDLTPWLEWPMERKALSTVVAGKDKTIRWEHDGVDIRDEIMRRKFEGDWSWRPSGVVIPMGDSSGWKLTDLWCDSVDRSGGVAMRGADTQDARMVLTMGDLIAYTTKVGPEARLWDLFAETLRSDLKSSKHGVSPTALAEVVAGDQTVIVGDLLRLHSRPWQLSPEQAAVLLREYLASFYGQSTITTSHGFHDLIGCTDDEKRAVGHRSSIEKRELLDEQSVNVFGVLALDNLIDTVDPKVYNAIQADREKRERWDAAIVLARHRLHHEPMTAMEAIAEVNAAVAVLCAEVVTDGVVPSWERQA